jgi:hypothetical protein
MTYRFEHFPNPAFFELHVSERLAGEGDQTMLLSLLNGTEGVAEVFLKPYTIGVSLGKVFERQQVEESVIETLHVFFWSHIPDEPWKQLPTINSKFIEPIQLAAGRPA